MSGIAALRALADAGVEATAFERGRDAGGLWVYENSNGLSAAYKSLQANTTKGVMSFSGFPMPDSFPDYPHHTQIAAYLNEFLDSFGGRSRIRFESTVTRAEQIPSGGWRIHSTQEGRDLEEYFDALVVCAGHHWAPKWPDPPYPGTFSGQQLHSHDYREPSALAGLRVLIVGMGNSAMDIAEDISHVASATQISARHGTHILPKYIFGRPLGRLTGPLMRLPWRLRQAVLARVLQAWRGPYERYGLQRPTVGIYQLHATLSDTILTRLAHGQIVAKPGIASFEDPWVTFVDGSREEVDAIVWCTGYNTELPFLPRMEIFGRGGVPQLFQRIFPLDAPDLAFIGYVSQRGALMPVVEAQSTLVADWITGGYALPAVDEMVAEIRSYEDEIRRRYFHTERHATEVEQGPYVKAVNTERRNGLGRASTQGRRQAPRGVVPARLEQPEEPR